VPDVEDLEFAEGEDDLLSDEQYSSPLTGTIVADVIVASGRYYVPETQIRRGVTSEESRKFPLAADCNRHAIILESAIMSNVLEETVKIITRPYLETLYICLHNPFVDPPLYQLRADVLSKGDVSNVCLCILLPSLEMADTEMVGSFTGSTFKSNALTLTHAIQDITKVYPFAASDVYIPMLLCRRNYIAIIC